MYRQNYHCSSNPVSLRMEHYLVTSLEVFSNPAVVKRDTLAHCGRITSVRLSNFEATVVVRFVIRKTATISGTIYLNLLSPRN